MSWFQLDDPAATIITESNDSLSSGGVDLGNINSLSSKIVWRGQSFRVNQNTDATYLEFRLGTYSRVTEGGDFLQDAVQGVATAFVYSTNSDESPDELLFQSEQKEISSINTIDATKSNLLPFYRFNFTRFNLDSDTTYIARLEANINNDGNYNVVWMGRSNTNASDHSGKMLWQRIDSSIRSDTNQDLHFRLGKDSSTLWVDDTTSWEP